MHLPQKQQLSRLLTLISLLFAAPAIQGCSAIFGTFDSAAGSNAGFESKPGAVPMRDGNEPLTTVRLDRSPTKVSPALKARLFHTGNASWYGPGFSGKKTARGDVFDDAKFTAAHLTLPLGTRAKVTNLANGKSVEVEINDRGPYVEGRIIDLSQAAANALGMIDRGIARVRIDLPAARNLSRYGSRVE